MRKFSWRRHRRCTWFSIKLEPIQASTVVKSRFLYCMFTFSWKAAYCAIRWKTFLSFLLKLAQRVNGDVRKLQYWSFARKLDDSIKSIIYFWFTYWPVLWEIFVEFSRGKFSSRIVDFICEWLFCSGQKILVINKVKQPRRIAKESRETIHINWRDCSTPHSCINLIISWIICAIKYIHNCIFVLFIGQGDTQSPVS